MLGEIPDVIRVASALRMARARADQLSSTNTITFTIRDGKIVDIEDVPSDLAAWDDFWA